MRTPIPRALLGAALLTTLAACGFSTDFEIRQTVTVDSSGAAVVYPIDLREIAGDAWSERDRIDDVKIKSATGTIVAVAETNTAEFASGTATVRRSSASPADEAVFADATDLPVAVGSTYDAVNLKAVSGVVKRALEGDGLLEIEAEAHTTAGVARFTADLVIKVEVQIAPF